MRSLEDIAAISDPKLKREEYCNYLQKCSTSPDVVTELPAFLNHVVNTDAVPLVLARQLLQLFVQRVATLPAEEQKAVAREALEKLHPRIVSYEEQGTALRELLAQLHEQDEEWSKAASILAGIDLDSSSRSRDEAYRLQRNIKIAMLYLEDDDSINAESYIKKASQHISNCQDEALVLQYRVCYARILDSKRRFLEAATRYYELSQLDQRTLGNRQVDERELDLALQQAAICTILAGAGPQRSRILATLMKDERVASIPQFPFMQRVYMQRILSLEQVQEMRGMLKPHQLAVLPDGYTVLERSVVEHNLMSTSHVYDNISFDELGALLQLPAAKAEKVACDMIQDGRLQGSIDQVEGVISFDDNKELLLQWDQHIYLACQAVNDTMDYLSRNGIDSSA